MPLRRWLALVVFALLLADLARAADPPMPATVVAGAKLVEVYGDDRFFEGPTWDPKGKRLYFTAFGDKSTQILRLDGPGKVHVWMDKTEGVNGTYLSREGRLLGAQAYGHRVVDYGFGGDGPADPKVLLHDPRLNQPNDICQTPNGNIYFTDPDFKNRKTSAVYLLTPDRKSTRILHDMPLPNGCIASNDGKTLYVGDSHLSLWRAYPIQSDGTVGPGSVFFDPPTPRRDAPDGMSIDERGNLYFCGRGGVWVVQPDGTSLGLIPVPEFCSNVTFGGDDGKMLYLTCSKKVYSLAMNVRGGQFRGDSK
jgi:gluconolactonase